MQRSLASLLLTFCFFSTFSQPLKGRFTTVAEDAYRFHYIAFNDHENATLQIPQVNHNEKPRAEFSLKYKIDNSILIITPVSMSDTTDNSILKRIAEARFQIKTDGTLYDTTSHYTYVPEQAARKFIKYITYIIDGVVYRAKNAEMRNGLIVKEYVLSRKLKKRFKTLRHRDYTLRIYQGREAYDKFGLLGLNVVLEYTRNR
jgi:hypothetical protein